MTKEYTAHDIWDEYQKSVNYLTQYNYFYKLNEDYRFCDGDQWANLECGGERFPQLNFIKPIVDYKTSTVNSNGNTIYYSCTDTGQMYVDGTEACRKLNALALKTWERLNMDSRLWVLTRNSAISGDSFLYSYWDEEKQIIDLTEFKGNEIFFADEQQRDIQKQKYIIIAQRRFASEIKQKARDNGVDEEEISLIKSDDNTLYEIGERAKKELEHDNDEGKLTYLVKLFKKDGYVYVVESVRDVIISKERFTGLKYYPIARMIWTIEEGSARGIGEVHNIIPNQIEVNKCIARYVLATKTYTLPHIVYDDSVLAREEVEKLSMVGTSIAISNRGVQDIRNSIDYLTPPGIPPELINIANNLMSLTRELAGASDIATGQINPEQASGAAIMAVRDAAALPLNFQAANLKAFIEAIARIWLDMWITYNPNTLSVIEQVTDDYGNEVNILEEIPTDFLRSLQLDVRVDVSPSNPFSKYAQESTLLNFLTAELIDFNEYVEALEDDSAAPKAKLKAIIEKRIDQQQMQQEQLINSQQMKQEQMLINQQNQDEQTALTLERLVNENSQLKEALNARIPQ